MIKISNLDQTPPYKKFKFFYDEAIKNNQSSIEAMTIASYSTKHNEVDSRFVNLKYIQKDKWIFFSNYDSKKAEQFNSHNQVSALLYWNKIDVQIRIKGKVEKTQEDISDNHYSDRKIFKNALAHSSQQSQKVNSFKLIEDKYNEVLKKENLLKKRPENWGGYSITPYYIEFWKGQESRLNHREVFELKNYEWVSFILQP